LFLFNFTDGLEAGEYTFAGTWFAPCTLAVEEGWYAGDCATPNEQVPVTVPFVEPVTITFN
jgi:hypothetical protein